MNASTLTPNTSRPDALSITFAALADPTRRAILARLATGEATVTELAAPFSHLSLPASSLGACLYSRGSHSSRISFIEMQLLLAGR